MGGLRPCGGREAALCQGQAGPPAAPNKVVVEAEPGWHVGRGWERIGLGGMICTVLCYLLLPAARLLRVLRDAFFTCRKNVLLEKSPTAQVGGISSVPSRRSVPEEEEALLQQQLEEEAGGLHSSETAPAVGKVSATLTSDWLEGSELLMTSLSNLGVASEVTWCSDQQHDELHTLMSLGPKEHVAVTLAKLPEEESVAMVGIAAWSAVRTQTDHQISGCTPSSSLSRAEDTAVLGWSLARDTEIVPVEATAWPFYDTGQFQPFPAERSYHEILWRDWEELSTQPAVPELGSENGPLFEFRVMSYNILAQDLVEQSPDLYLHCQPDILDWSYRLPNLLQEIQHWDPDVLCLQEVQENHYWEQLEPTFRMMGFVCLYKRRTGKKTDGCAVCYKHSRFQLISASPVEYFRPGLDILNRDNVGLVLLLQPLLPEGVGQKATSPLCVANTHVLYNPRRGDIKLAQMALLLAEVDKIAKTVDGIYCPVILCGDLNAVPDSPLYKFIRNGQLSYHGMPAWKVSGQEDFSQQLHQRKLQTPLWPSSLGITENCQYVSLCQPKKSDRRKYSRNFLLQFRFCDAACERPTHLILWKGVTDVKPDRPAHWPKHLTMVNDPDPELFFPSHFLPQRGRPEVTTMPMGLGATVDYIFYSAEPIENGNEGGRRLYRDGALKLLGRLSLLSEDVLWLANGLPNPFCSSDHLCLLASFGLEISSA
ncbi:protein angel homolog 1 isoform X2 [Trachemys scripta elegans]|uniref:protein angel homolog 1 isoform X2 n=1 Tax=Trachemys scripta elegans TaxID=31138 RepID=UPI001552E8E2|nr:protein angel homolog 1 isoform X2 [Trachemys scripta elegans]